MGPTKPSENLFFRGLWGWAATLWERLQSTGGKLHTALHGYDGSDWQKLGYVWNYYDRWSVRLSITSPADGNQDVGTGELDAGYVYVAQAFTSLCWETILTHQFYAVPNGSSLILDNVLNSPANQVCVCRAVPVVLKPGDELRVRFFGTNEDDHLQVFIWGYKMALAM